MQIARQLCYIFFLIIASVSASSAISAEVDWKKVRGLQGKALLEYAASLGLKGQSALTFWKNIPLSKANKQVNQIFREEAFAIYMNKYPRPFGKSAEFSAGSGTDIVGPISKQKLRLPFTKVQPLPAGPVGDAGRTYNIAYSIHGLSHPWLLNNADSAMWEAQRHPNVSLQILDPKFDNAKQAQQIDALIEEKIAGLKQ